MSPAPLIVVTVVCALGVWLVRGRMLVASAAGIVGLAAALVAIGLEQPGASFTVAGLALVATDYSRLLLAVAGASFLVLALLDLTTISVPVGSAAAKPTADDEHIARQRGAQPAPDSGDEVPVEPSKRRRSRTTVASTAAAAAPATIGTALPGAILASPSSVPPMPVPLGTVFLVALAFLAVGLPAADPAGYRYVPNAVGPEIALLLLTAAGIAVLPAALRGVEDLGSLRTALRELRLIGAAGGLALVGAAWLALLGAHALPDPQASTAGLAFIGTAAVLRMGAVPLHAVRARLGATLPAPLVALVAVWLPAGFVLAGLAWSRAALTPLGLAAPGEASAALVAVAFATLVAGSLAATLQDDLRRLVIYSVIGDGGMALLALAAGTTASAPAARAWLLVYALSKTALVGWAIAMRRAYGTDLLEELRGWARYAPLLGLALLAVALGSVGLPGWGTFEVRQRLIQNALDGAWPWTPILGAAAWMGVLPYLRLVLVGLRAPTPTVRDADSEWPALRHGRAGAPAWIALRRLPPRLTASLGVAVQHAPTFAASLVLALALLLLALGAGQTLLVTAAGAG